MNILKIQQEILKSLLSDGKDSVHFFDYDSDHTFVTTNWKVGYILPNESLRVILRDAQTMMELTDEIISTVLLANRLVGTDEYRNGGVARKYFRKDNPETAIYIDTNLLKHFRYPELYQKKGDPTGQVVVTERVVGSSEDEIVGIVMPTKIAETTDENY